MRAIAGGEDDLVIVNSCAVTAEAVRQARQAIRRARRARPDARHRSSPAAPRRSSPSASPRCPRSMRVLGNRREAGRQPAGDRTRRACGSRTSCAVRETAPHSRPASPPTPAPSSRCRTAATIAAPSASSPMAAAIRRSVPGRRGRRADRGAGRRGLREVVLTGVDITSYGADLPGAPISGQLVERDPRASSRSLPRLRLSSLDSVEIDPRLFELIAQRAARDAASPSVAAGRRRPDPQADEAPHSRAAGDRDRRSG